MGEWVDREGLSTSLTSVRARAVIRWTKDFRKGALLFEKGLGKEGRGGGGDWAPARLTRVRRFSYRATRVPPRASIAAMADWEAFETVMWTFGVRKYSTPCTVRHDILQVSRHYHSKGSSELPPTGSHLSKTGETHVSEKFDAVVDPVDTPRFEQFAHRDRP